ncbi:hypothetical protein F5B21DRAFT_520268 [Xylaria acuta]|nr:hypothetical protein F5B21DRAFT_520268 [Xylaria acuta]
MQFSAIFATAILALSVTANKHKYCNCHVDGDLDVGLSHKTCTAWGQSYPNTEWVSTRASCHDYVKGGGIPGERWEPFCKANYGGDAGKVRGNCFEK